MILITRQMTVGQIAKLQLIISYLPSDWAPFTRYLTGCSWCNADWSDTGRRRVRSEQQAVGYRRSPTGKGVVENKLSTDVEPSNQLRVSIPAFTL